MDINGLTPQQSGLQVASRVGAFSVPSPPVSEKDSGFNASAAIKSETGQSAADALRARSQANVRSGTRIHVDEATERVVVEIVNADDEVIKQIPPEEVLRIAARFQQLTGLIFDQEV